MSFIKAKDLNKIGKSEEYPSLSDIISNLNNSPVLSYRGISPIDIHNGDNIHCDKFKKCRIVKIDFIIKQKFLL